MGEAVRVQQVVAPTSGAVSFTVVDETFTPVEPAEAYLAHLVAIERSPNTVRPYASSLKLFFEYLESREVAFDAVQLDDIGRFVSALRAPAEGVIVIETSLSRRAESTVNRHLRGGVRAL